MSDLISRQEAIETVKRLSLGETDATRLAMRIMDYLERLSSAQPEQQWIPLGRPMNSGMYLVTLRQKFEGKETYRVRIIRLNNGHWVLPKHFPEWINEEMEQEVLAWMPLPEPYTEGEQNDES